MPIMSSPVIVPSPAAPLTFRAATRADAVRVAALVNSAYRGESSKRGWTTEADLLGGQRTDPEGVIDMIEAPGSCIVLAFDAHGTLIGCVRLQREAGGSCYLGLLTVDPTRQAQGAGRLMMDHSEMLAREWGCSCMRMTVIHLREELLRYYERRGYTRTGREEPFPENDPRFGLPRTKLVLLEMTKPLGAAGERAVQES
jgi:GNAT superfamily N-acetyltransferase